MDIQTLEKALIVFCMQLADNREAIAECMTSGDVAAAPGIAKQALFIITEKKPSEFIIVMYPPGGEMSPPIDRLGTIEARLSKDGRTLQSTKSRLGNQFYASAVITKNGDLLAEIILGSDRKASLSDLLLHRYIGDAIPGWDD